MKINLRTALLCGNMVMLVPAMPAWAQDQSTTPVATPPTTTNQPEYGQDIIVTASRRSESIRNVPEQITALTGEDLSKRNARSLDEFVGFVPGLNIQSDTPGSNLIVVRGVTTGSQQSNAVGAYLDDVPLNSSSGFGQGQRQLSINAFDLDRIEVLSGPQGTLYGASSLGGTIRYITARPQLDRPAARLEGEVSSTDHGGTNTSGRGMINMPLVQDRLAFRASVVQQYDTGFADDPVLGLKNQGDNRVIAARASLLAQVTPDLDVQVTGLTEDIVNKGINSVDRDPITHALTPGEGTYQQSYTLPQRNDQSIKLVYGTVNLDVGFAKLTSITSYQREQLSSALDISTIYSGLFGTLLGFGPLGVNPYRDNLEVNLKKFTQEARLVSNPGRVFDWVVGVYYTDERAGTAVTVLNQGDPRGLLLGFPIFTGSIPTTYREIAGYADGTLHFTPRLDLTLGIRYSHNSQSFTESLTGLLGNPLNPNATNTIGAASKENTKTYLINPRFKVNDDVSLYVRVANGFRPGGPNYVVAGGTQEPRYQPDTLWTYEVGAKASLLDRRLQATLALYDTEWSKIQVTAVVSGVAQLTNAGDARIRGGELALSYRASHALSLNGSLSYTDAKLTTTAPPLGITYEGARLPVSPRWAFAVGADYSVDLGNGHQARLSVSDRYQGPRYSGFVGSTAVLPYRLNAFNLVDADLSVGVTTNLEVGVYAKNLLNSHGEIYGDRTNDLYVPSAPANVSLTRPRTIGLQARLKI
ncbi:TonB-dependent receptor [Sphingomonas bacterium]|uniref:TonB-dependent receptor n=1 Tax=Sphingomonas bacterium TaxID=1895847 RepID=UPI00157538CC|nr:TonB-dependent receptor [Sphingomonas bacterium]